MLEAKGDFNAVRGIGLGKEYNPQDAAFKGSWTKIEILLF